MLNLIEMLGFGFAVTCAIVLFPFDLGQPPGTLKVSESRHSLFALPI